MPAPNTRRPLALMQCECQRRDAYGGRMERSELEALLDPRVLAAVDEESRPETPADVLARSTALRRAGFAPEQAAAVLTQAALRRRARAKFGEFADRMLLTRSGLEQATRLEVAPICVPSSSLSASPAPCSLTCTPSVRSPNVNTGSSAAGASFSRNHASRPVFVVVTTRSVLSETA